MNIPELWDQIIVQAIFVRALEFLYGVLSDVNLASWGVAIIAFTFIVKTLTLPLTLKSLQSMKRMQELQPMLQAIQKQYKNDREALAQAQMALYKEHGVNPVAGCLPMLIQMPVWIALYSALFYLAQNNPEFSKPFLWIENLGQPEFQFEQFPAQLPILALLTGVTQWITTRMAMRPTTDAQQQTMNQVMQLMPVMFIFFSLSVPAGLVLYWVASNVYQMVQQYFITGWGQLIPGRAQTLPAASPPPRSNPPPQRPRTDDGKPQVEVVGSDDASQPRTPSKSGRRRRNKRR